MKSRLSRFFVIVDRKLTALTPCQGAAGNCWS